MPDEPRSNEAARAKNAARKTTQIVLEEARVVIPGLQALFGFQMISVFNQRFDELPRVDQLLHLAAVALTVLSIALIMAPTAYHRIVEPESGSEFFVRFASRLVAAAMAPLMVSLSIDVYVVARVILADAAAAAAVAVVLFVVLASMWFVYPLAKKALRKRA